MKLLETPEEKKSFGITTAVFVVLFILFAFFGLTYMDPPPENGIAVNFGTSDTGSGDIQPIEPPKTTQEEAQSEPEASEEQTLTQDADAPVTLPKTEKKKPVTKPAETKPTETPKKKVNSALDKIANKSDGSGKTSHGDDPDGNGDKGKENGSLYENGLYGNGKGNGGGGGNGAGNGSGYVLSGRSALEKPDPSNNCNEAGKIVVEVTVDKNGNVLSAVRKKGVPGASVSICLMAEAKKAALRTKWSPSATGAEKQLGTITYNFSFN